jgi:hypothetical protein
MKKQIAYIETTVISYLVARPNRHFLTAARQEITRTWWRTRLREYDPCVSEIVEQEIREGDKEMVALRLAAITGFQFLVPDPRIDVAIAQISAKKILPSKAISDLAHLTFAAVHEVPLVVTWNFRHLANERILPQLRKAFAALDLVLPEVFTPEQLLTVR